MQEAEAKRIRDYVEPFCTPISLVLPDETGALRGTGTLLEVHGQPYLLTCDHIARERLKGSLAIGMGRSIGAVRLINPIFTGDSANDVAVTRLPREALEGSDKRTMPMAAVVEAFSPGANAMLLVHGFPGFLDVPHLATKFYEEHQVLRVRPFAVVGPVEQLPSIADPRLHFAIKFTPEQMLTVTAGRGRITPHGLSGSAVWDTGAALGQAADWIPERFRLVGMAVEWIEAHSVLICLKVEVLRRFILRSLRLEAAYFRSLKREEVGGDALSDWLWAEKSIADIDK